MFWRQTWTKYTAQKEKFTVDLPGVPKREFHSISGDDTLDDGASPASIVYLCTVREKIFFKTIYQVAVTRVMDYAGPPEDFLQVGLSEMLKSIDGAALIGQSPGSFKGFPAIRYKMTVKEVFALTGVMLLRGKTIYNLSVLHGGDKEQQAESFFQSLVLN